MSASKARALLRLERAGDVCPKLREAYRSGRLSWVKCQCLLPLLLLDLDGEWRRSYARERRAQNLAEWHGLLLQRLDLNDTERRLDRIASHRALAGPEADFMKAQIRHLRGEKEQAQRLIEGCLKQLPGHGEFIAFARQIGARLPPQSAQILRERDL